MLVLCLYLMLKLSLVFLSWLLLPTYVLPHTGWYEWPVNKCLKVILHCMIVLDYAGAFTAKLHEDLYVRNGQF